MKPTDTEVHINLEPGISGLETLVLGHDNSLKLLKNGYYHKVLFIIYDNLGRWIVEADTILK